MTMKEFREEIARKTSPNATCALYGLDSLANYYREISRVIEALWKHGHIEEYSNDILRAANGFLSSVDADFHIMQTLDLHSITAGKQATKLFAEYLLFS